MEFSSQRREMLLFLTTNVAAVMSGANHQKNFLRLGAKSRLETKRKQYFVQIARTYYEMWRVITEKYLQEGMVNDDS